MKHARKQLKKFAESPAPILFPSRGSLAQYGSSPAGHRQLETLSPWGNPNFQTFYYKEPLCEINVFECFLFDFPQAKNKHNTCFIIIKKHIVCMFQFDKNVITHVRKYSKKFVKSPAPILFPSGGSLGLVWELPNWTSTTRNPVPLGKS